MRNSIILSILIFNSLILLTSASGDFLQDGLSSWIRKQWRSLKQAIGVQSTEEVFECGKTHVEYKFASDKSPRIFQGVISKWHSWPWIVSIMNREKGAASLQNCAGSLISDDVVLTAAHCVSTIDSNKKPIPIASDMVKIAVGVHTILGQMNFLNYYRVKFIRLHPKYRPCCSYDVAIVKLTEKQKRSDKINTICLPAANLTSIYNRLAVIAGWGIDSKRESWYSMNSLTLKHGEVTILADDECSRRFIGYNREDEVCAINNVTFTDARSGDSGGPLMLLEDGRWVLVGITSHGLASDSSMPGFYSKLIGKMDFLKEYLNKSC